MAVRQLVVGTAGHIDHGKTALTRALTGIDTDRLAQEKQRGISIDLGFAHLDLGSVHLGIVDVPGHERFIRNMLAGAVGIDLALLVVAADDSVMPQTREHLAILELLQVRRGLVVLTKMDLVESSWLDLVEDDVRDLVRGTCLEGEPIIRTSSIAGTGLDELKDALRSLCSTLEPVQRGDLFRMAIDRSFTIPGLGAVVTGTVWSGRVSAGDEIECQPSGKLLRVRGVQCHGESIDSAGQGQRAAIDVIGAHHTEIQRGDEVATPGFLRPTQWLTVRVRVLDDSPWPIRHRARVRLHLGTREVTATVRLLVDQELQPRQSAVAQLVCAEDVVACCRQPFVLRSESPRRTIGGGVVLQPRARRLARGDADSRRWLEALVADEPDRRAEAAISLRGAELWSALDLACEADVPLAAVEGLRARLAAARRVVQLAAESRQPRWLHAEQLERLRRRVTDTVRRAHDAEPLEVAVPRSRIHAWLTTVDPKLVDAVLDQLIEDATLIGDAASVALPDFRPALTDAQRRLHERIIETFRAAAFRPPEPTALVCEAGIPEPDGRRLIELCVTQRHLVHLEGDVYLHRDHERELRRRIAQHLEGSDGLTVSEIKDLFQTSRKFAVPMCEYLDRAGVTRRVGDRRVLAGTARPAPPGPDGGRL